MATNDVKITLSATDKTRGAFNSAQQGLKNLKSTASGVTAALGAIGVGVSVAGLVGFVKSTINARDEIAKLSQRTGLAVETLAGLQHAADLSGVEVEQLGKGVRTFSVLVSDAANGSKSAQEKISGLGLSFKDLRALSPEKQFYKLADAVSKLGEQDRAAAISGALGDRMSVLVPLLSGGATEMRKLVEEGQRLNPVTEESAKQAEAFNDNLERLKKEAGLAGIQLTENLIPSLADTAQAMVNLSRDGKGALAILRGFAGLGKLPFDLIFGDIKVTNTAAERLKELRGELNKLQGDLKSAESGGKSSKMMRAIFGTPEEIKQQVNIIKNQIAVLEKFGDKVFPKKTGATKPGNENGAQIECIANGGTWNGTSCKRKSSGSSKSDPLAGLLASTDIGKLKEFDKQVALLNQRFNYGKKDAELYAQAMTKLVESTFSNNFKQASDDAKELAETQGLVADHLKQTEDELRAQTEAWKEAGQAIENEYKAPLVQLEERLAYLDELFRRNLISAEALSAAYADAFDNVGKSTEKAAETMDTFAKTAAKNIQNSFADFLFNPFENGLKGMAQSFGQMIQKMIADAVAADLTRRLFGETGSGGAAGGILAGLGKFLGFATGGTTRGAGISAYSGSVVSRPTLFPFASGIGLMGEAGAEAILPLKRGRDGKLGVSSGGGGHTINVYVNGTNAPDVRRAAGQGAREALGMLNGARRYG